MTATIFFFFFFFTWTILVMAIKDEPVSEELTTTSSSKDEQPFFDVPTNNVTVPIGREAILSCSVSNLGNFRLGWVKLDDQTILSLHTKVVTHNPRFSLSLDGHAYQMHIRQVREADKGCYMCQINTSPMMKQVSCLDVNIPPDIIDDGTSSDVTVQEGDNATLNCRAQGQPQPKVTWRREDGSQLLLKRNRKSGDKVDSWNGDSLLLTKVDRRQMGAYLCIASNDIPPAVSKRVSLNINFKPKTAVRTQLVGSPLGAEVKLECQIEAFPASINYWLRDPEQYLLHGPRHKVLEERDIWKSTLKLIISDLQDDDLGSYTCLSTNSLGTDSANIRLYEIKLPTTTLPPTTTTIVTTKSTAPTTSRPTTRFNDVTLLITPELNQIRRYPTSRPEVVRIELSNRLAEINAMSKMDVSRSPSSTSPSSSNSSCLSSFFFIFFYLRSSSIDNMAALCTYIYLTQTILAR